MALINCKECGREISDKAESCPHCGYKKENIIITPLGSRPTTPNKKNSGCSNFFIFILALGMILFALDRCFTPELTEQERQEQIEKSRLNSDLSWGYKSAKEEVLKKLKSPSTAKFADFSKIKYRDHKDGTYIIESYVDSQNSFGATVRTKFRCTITKYGMCEDLIFYE